MQLGGDFPAGTGEEDSGAARQPHAAPSAVRPGRGENLLGSRSVQP